VGFERRFILGVVVVAAAAGGCQVDAGGLLAADPTFQDPSGGKAPAVDTGRATPLPPDRQAEPLPPAPAPVPPPPGEGGGSEPALPPPAAPADAGAEDAADAIEAPDGGPDTGVIEAPPRAPLLWLAFDDVAGRQMAADRSGHAQHAVLRGVDARMAWIRGRVGGAVDLTAGGSTGHLVVPGSELLDRIAGQLSVSAWIRLPPEQDPGIIVARPATGRTGPLFRLEVKDRRLKVQLPGAGGDALLALESDRAIPTGRWVHVAMVFDGQTVRLFLEGTRVASAPHAAPLPPSSEPLTIGAGAISPGPEPRTADHLPGQLDELFVFDRALTDRELTTLVDGDRL
jgi:hypothetical protein